MRTVIKNVIFDIGNVLLNYDPGGFLRSEYGDEIADELLPVIFQGEEWQRLDRGVLTDAEAIRIFSEACPHRKEQIEDIMSRWIYLMTPIQPSIERLHDLHERGYKLYYLSNYQKERFRDVSERYDFWSVFLGGILSCDLKLLKPEPEIYQALLDQYSLKAEECVFLDDMPVNIEAAKAAGWHGIVFRDPTTALAELETLLA